MTKDEALAFDLALEALQFALHVGFDESSESQIKKGDKAWQQHQQAITAIKQARALDKKAENARELGLDYEPAGLIARLKHPEDHYGLTDPKKANAVLMSLCQEAADALAAQQEHEPENEPHVSLASVQEPVATVIKKGADRQWMSERLASLPDGIYSLYTTPPAAAVQERTDYAVHLNHCNIGECQGVCKYGDDDCPALKHADMKAKWDRTTPPAAQRQWVGLTAGERDALFTQHYQWDDYGKAIEAKLKEKNT
jgi:hypothetical protein